jgi:hypothetical protein
VTEDKEEGRMKKMEYGTTRSIRKRSNTPVKITVYRY